MVNHRGPAGNPAPGHPRRPTGPAPDPDTAGDDLPPGVVHLATPLDDLAARLFAPQLQTASREGHLA